MVLHALLWMCKRSLVWSIALSAAQDSPYCFPTLKVFKSFSLAVTLAAKSWRTYEVGGFMMVIRSNLLRQQHNGLRVVFSFGISQSLVYFDQLT